jgi:metallo-beta-lactamase class B
MTRIVADAAVYWAMLAAALAVVLALASAPQATPQLLEWNRAVEPVHVLGPLYYVGTENITSLLVTTPKGHALIDAGLDESAPIILENIRKLGFRVEDVKVVLCTHAHLDHAGGLARIKAATGARIYIGAADAALLARGGRGDFAFGDTLQFPPVIADESVRDGQEIVLGGLRIRAVATPGHTKGCTSWSFAVQDGPVVRQVLMIGGTSAPGYRLVNNAAYPAIAADFEATFKRLRSLPADIVFEGHGFAFDLEARRAGRRPFVDAGALEESVGKAEAAFRKQLNEQSAKLVSRRYLSVGTARQSMTLVSR